MTTLNESAVTTSWRPTRVGDRVIVVRLLHSHFRTREAGRALIDQTGTILRFVRDGVLVEMDDDWHLNLPHRRWYLHLGDLEIQQVEGPSGPRHRHGIGVSAERRRHAVALPAARGMTTAACGARVQLVIVAGDAPRFDPSLSRVCADCIRLVPD